MERQNIMEKELRLEMRLKNNRLIKARERLGFNSAHAFADAVDLSYSTVREYESLRRSPVSKDEKKLGEWKESARSVAELLGESCEYFWPESVCQVVTSTITRELDVEALKSLIEAPKTPLELLEEAELSKVVGESLEVLSPRERKVMRLRFGIGESTDLTLREVGLKDGGVAPEAVRQIESRALSKLRHPSHSKVLEEFAEENIAEWRRWRRSR